MVLRHWREADLSLSSDVVCKELLANKIPSRSVMRIGRFAFGVLLFAFFLAISPGCRDHDREVLRHLKFIYIALLNYSDLHGGRFPDGGQNEADSLGLLARELDANISPFIAGPNVPKGEVRTKIDRDIPLGVNDISWHYVPGLALTDNPDIAVVWEKENRHERHRAVLYINGEIEFVSNADWKAFSQKQQQLLKEKGPSNN